MDKEKALEKIDYVLLRRSGTEYVRNVLESVKTFIETQSGFDYYTMMQFIESQMSGKLGGVYAYANTALCFLKEELKAEIRKEKKELRNEKIRENIQPSINKTMD